MISVSKAACLWAGRTSVLYWYSPFTCSTETYRLSLALKHHFLLALVSLSLFEYFSLILSLKEKGIIQPWFFWSDLLSCVLFRTRTFISVFLLQSYSNCLSLHVSVTSSWLRTSWMVKIQLLFDPDWVHPELLVIRPTDRQTQMVSLTKRHCIQGWGKKNLLISAFWWIFSQLSIVSEKSIAFIVIKPETILSPTV